MFARILVFGCCLLTLLTSSACSQSDTAATATVRAKSSAATTDHDWPRFLGSRFDGVVHDPPRDIDWSAHPRFRWALSVGDGYGIGTVSGGRYFHFDADGSFPRRSSNERLRCFDVETGKEIWSRTQQFQYSDLLGYEDGPRSSPTIDGDRVFTLGVTGRLTCRDVADGREVWSIDTNEQYGVVQNFFGVGSSPLVLGRRVIVMIGGSPPEDQDIAPMRLDRVSPNGSAVVAFDRDTGKELWRCGDDLASYSSPRPIEINGAPHVLVFARGGLLAVDPEQGKVRWRFDHRAEILESVNAMMPVVEDNHVFISECYQVGSVLLKAGAGAAAVIWKDPDRDRRNQAMRCHWSTPILVDGFLYGCSGRNAPDSDLRCIDFKTGQVQWSDPRRIRSSLTRVGDHLIVLEERGEAQVIKANPKRMEEVSRWNLHQRDGDRPAISYPCWAAPIVVGKKVILRGTDHVLCLELGTRRVE